MTKILIITKYREMEVWDGTDYSIQKYNSGVYLSAQFVTRMLNSNGYEAVLEHAIDNNCIDRLVTTHSPDIVIIEAYWVVPEKFEELIPLHPNVKWVVRNHSAMPFIAEEGIIVDWSLRYIDYDNVHVGFNNRRTYEEFKYLAAQKEKEYKINFLPNYYPLELIKTNLKRELFSIEEEIHIGCFGAIRPLKNNLSQAYAAIKFANELGRKLYFHVNANDVEHSNSPALKNIKSLFNHSENAELVIHEWMSHEDFYTLCGTMDVGLQVSFSETFNIVAADLVANGVPVIGSAEIDFIPEANKADLSDSNDIIKKLKKILKKKLFSTLFASDNMLSIYSRDSIRTWKMEIFKILASKS